MVMVLPGHQKASKMKSGRGDILKGQVHGSIDVMSAQPGKNAGQNACVVQTGKNVEVQ